MAIGWSSFDLTRFEWADDSNSGVGFQHQNRFYLTWDLLRYLFVYLYDRLLGAVANMDRKIGIISLVFSFCEEG